jgi:CubicO group peptidase (beta-lactamase class C family)
MRGTSLRALSSLSLLVILLLSLGTWPVQAVASVSSGSPTDPGELEAFLDGLISKQLDEYHIPGATVAVVKDGELFFAKGYGYANLEKRIPVVADQTLFRIGSTSKLFIWTAVMQLAEQGKLDLNADVNTYLKDFKIPDTYPQPITMLHLMSHTAGFEERTLGMVAPNAEAMMPLGEFLARFPPARVRPPGQFTAYSNYGTTLAAYIVEQVSGMPFEQYVEGNIFRPLGMAHSTFRQPVPAELQSALAVASSYDGAYHPAPFLYMNTFPVGGMFSTATDMARFMIAHLQDGRYCETSCKNAQGRILQDATARQMHQRLFANDPRLSGFAYGFMDRTLNGQRIIEHGGYDGNYTSLLALLPEQRVGVFVAFNGSEALPALPRFLQAFLDRYYPVPAPQAPAPPAGFYQRAGRYTGAYRITRTSYTVIDRVAYLLNGGGYGKVAANPGGTLTLDFNLPAGRFYEDYIEVEPLVFRSTDGRRMVIFQEDGQGHITHLFLEQEPKYALEKIAWYETPWFSQTLLAICVVIFLSVLLAGAVGALAGRRQRVQARTSRLARGLALGISAFQLAFGAATILMVSLGNLGYGIPAFYQIFLGLELVAAGLTAGLVVLTILAWRGEY